MVKDSGIVQHNMEVDNFCDTNNSDSDVSFVASFPIAIGAVQLLQLPQVLFSVFKWVDNADKQTRN